MGWWKMASDGGIDFGTPPSGAETNLANAIPGRDTGEDHYMGDTPADIMGRALEEIAQAYFEEWGRWPFLEELQGCLDFVTGPHRDAGVYKPDDAPEDEDE